MTTDSFLALACASLVAFIFGLVLCFDGYRFFLILLPIWGLFFGLVFCGIIVQARVNRTYTIESYNRWAEPV